MKKWLRGTRGVITMVLTWTVGWGLGFGGLMEIFDPHGQIGDVWPTALAIPGFFGGVIFSALLWIAERGRGADELPLPRVAAWGAVTGVPLAFVVGSFLGSGMFPFPDMWQRVAATFGTTILLSIVAAVASALVFRYAARMRTPAGARTTG